MDEQDRPRGHGIALFTVDLFHYPRHYIVHVTCKCGIEFNVHCDRIVRDGSHEADGIIWQHQQTVYHEDQGFAAFSASRNSNVPQQSLADIRELGTEQHFAATKVAWATWGETITAASREAEAYARLEIALRNDARLDAQLKVL
jgi:hypothetical protein